MREVPVFTAPDGSPTLTPNGSATIPLHQLPPKEIFDLFMCKSKLMDEHNVTLALACHYPVVHMLMLDGTDALAARIGAGENTALYATPSEAFDYIKLNKPVVADVDKARDYFAFILGNDVTQEQAAASMDRHKRILSLAQSIVDSDERLSINTESDSGFGQTTSCGVDIIDALDRGCISFFDAATRAMLAQAITLCDTASCRVDEVTGKLCYRFSTFGCMTYAQLVALYERRPCEIPPELADDGALNEFVEYVKQCEAYR